MRRLRHLFLLLLCLCGCGFRKVGGGADLAPVPDGGCTIGADLASSCPEPGPGSCVDVIECWTSCFTGDAACQTDCYARAKNAQSRTDAQSYIDCRSVVLTSSGACWSFCQDSSPAGQDGCIACLHVCSYDAQCRYACSCGQCAAQLAACFQDQ
jgi:hypothetical protein